MIVDTDMNKDVTIQMRLTSEEHKRWLEAATAEDRSLSNWIRRQCNAAAPAADPEIVKRVQADPMVKRHASPKKGRR